MLLAAFLSIRNNIRPLIIKLIYYHEFNEKLWDNKMLYYWLVRMINENRSAKTKL